MLDVQEKTPINSSAGIDLQECHPQNVISAKSAVTVQTTDSEVIEVKLAETDDAEKFS